MRSLGRRGNRGEGDDSLSSIGLSGRKQTRESLDDVNGSDRDERFEQRFVHSRPGALKRGIATLIIQLVRRHTRLNVPALDSTDQSGGS